MFRSFNVGQSTFLPNHRWRTGYEDIWNSLVHLEESERVYVCVNERKTESERKRERKDSVANGTHWAL